MEKVDVLKDVSLRELELELARRKEQQVDDALVRLPDEQLANEIENKKLNEFQEQHDKMFPGVTGEQDYFYPKWKEAREEQVREALKNKNKKMSLGESMYPKMSGRK
jgi:hypothetical protein